MMSRNLLYQFFKNGFLYVTVIFSWFLIPFSARASHMIGGDVTYRCLGGNNFRITITLYQDCLNGEQVAIANDVPLEYAIYRNTPSPQFYQFGSIQDNTAEVIPTGFSNECINNIPNSCLRRQRFVFDITLAPDPAGYVIVYQRCCRNNVIQNLINPGNIGVTYYATIPGFANGNCPNNSAVFNNEPPQIICSANPFTYDFSATDVDGDSLTYSLCDAKLGGAPNNDKPQGSEISPPPYQSVPYLPPYSAVFPMSGFPPLQINPETGIMTITPNTTGRFVVSVCVSEWRNGTIINTLSRDVQFIVTNCSKAVVANIPQYSNEPNTYIVECEDFTVFFVNESTGGFNYLWDFGDGTTSTEFQPTHTYSDTGVYEVKLVVNQGSTCPDSITRLVKVYPVIDVGFIFDGIHCPEDSISFTDQSTATYLPFQSWQWDFGDGNSSDVQNPKHAYTQGGAYNVQLIATTQKGCMDTAVNQVLIDDFDPDAGNDTIIVLGYPYSLSASGGDFFHWTPADYLSDPNIPNPSVNFPDTGWYTYIVDITSEAGCAGRDTINILVVKEGGVLMPNAFSPNGDGLNDFVKPMLIGYPKLNYFRIFNRWGQMVYNTNNLEVGWDGYFSGQAAELSTYFWVVSAVNLAGEEKIVKGDLILLR